MSTQSWGLGELPCLEEQGGESREFHCVLHYTLWTKIQSNTTKEQRDSLNCLQSDIIGEQRAKLEWRAQPTSSL